MTVDDVGFEISDKAEKVIRGRTGELWIWPSEDGKPYVSSWPPAVHDGGWTTYTPERLVIHVDSAVEPPKQWVLDTVESEQWVRARWDGRQLGVFDRLPLVRPPEEAVEPHSSPLAHVAKFLLVPALAWVFAGLWALQLLGMRGHWFWAARGGVSSQITLVGLVFWAREARAAEEAPQRPGPPPPFYAGSAAARVRLDQRADRALAKELERSRL
jgi:hypothetical protein